MSFDPGRYPAVTDWNESAIGSLSISSVLLNAFGEDGSGAWIDTRALDKFSVEFVPTGFTGSVQLFGTNEDAPTPATAGVAIGTAETAAAIQLYNGPYRFVKAVMSSYSAGSMSAFLHGVS